MASLPNQSTVCLSFSRVFPGFLNTVFLPLASRSSSSLALVHQQCRKCCWFLYIVFDAPHCSKTLVLVTLMEYGVSYIQGHICKQVISASPFLVSVPFVKLLWVGFPVGLQRKVIQFPPRKMMLALELSLGGFICGGAFTMHLTYCGGTVDFANASSTNLDMAIWLHSFVLKICFIDLHAGNNSPLILFWILNLVCWYFVYCSCTWFFGDTAGIFSRGFCLALGSRQGWFGNASL